MKLKGLWISVCLVLTTSMVNAQDVEPGTVYEVTVTNVTKAQIFSPPLVVTHKDDISLFTLGEPAFATLAPLAEDGNNGPLAEELADLSDLVFQTASFDGPILPGESATIEIRGYRGFRQLSVIGMLVTTNDTFFATESTVPIGRYDWIKARTTDTTVTTYGPAFDAGTEANSEDCAHIPGPPCGNAGVRPDEAAEGYVYVSNGIHGIADIDASAYDWRDFVAVVTIRRK